MSERVVVELGHFYQSPIARIRIKFIYTLPYLQFLIQQPNGLIKIILRYAIREISYRFIFFEIQLDLRLDSKRLGAHLHEEPSGKQQDKNTGVLDPLEKEGDELPVGQVEAVVDQGLVFEIQLLLLELQNLVRLGCHVVLSIVEQSE